MADEKKIFVSSVTSELGEECGKLGSELIADYSAYISRREAAEPDPVKEVLEREIKDSRYIVSLLGAKWGAAGGAKEVCRQASHFSQVMSWVEWEFWKAREYKKAVFVFTKTLPPENIEPDQQRVINCIASPDLTTAKPFKDPDDLVKCFYKALNRQKNLEESASREERIKTVWILFSFAAFLMLGGVLVFVHASANAQKGDAIKLITAAAVACVMIVCGMLLVLCVMLSRRGR